MKNKSSSICISILFLTSKYKLIFSILLAFFLGLSGFDFPQYAFSADDPLDESARYRIEARRWEDAEKMFHSDPRWLGGDGASSVDLGDGRVLWLFGDSLIDLSGKSERRESGMIHNSIAIQTGYDPVNADMKFFWRMRGKNPVAFFSPRNDHWYWPASGIMVGNRLLIFLMEITSADNALGFDARGWKAVLIENPRQKPDHWILTYLISPQKNKLIVGSGNPVIENGFLIVFATDSQDMGVYLVKWPEKSARAGTLTRPRLWAGDEAGWIQFSDTKTAPHPIMQKGQMEFSVAYVPQLKRYLQIQTMSIQNPCLAMAAAKTLTGPWSSQVCFFTPNEQGKPDMLIYAGKSHSMLKGADLVFTYVVNTTITDRLLKDMSIYFPVMLKGKIKTY